MRSAKTRATIIAARAHRDGAPDDFAIFLKHELFWCIQNTWRYQEDIDLVSDDEYSALRLANETLRILECDSPNDFFEFAVDLIPDENDGLFPELHDKSSADHRSLVNFIRRALESEHEIVWGH